MQYKNLSIDYFQSGLDDNLNSLIEIERVKNGQKGNKRDELHLDLINVQYKPKHFLFQLKFLLLVSRAKFFS